MKTASRPRGATAPPAKARSRSECAPNPLSSIKDAIVAWLERGPCSAGAITFLALNSRVRAQVRDKALRELIREGRVRAAEPQRLFGMGKPSPFFALTERSACTPKAG